MNRKNTRYIDKSNAHCGGGTLMCCRHSYTRVGYHITCIGIVQPRKLLLLFQTTFAPKGLHTLTRVCSTMKWGHPYKAGPNPNGSGPVGEMHHGIFQSACVGLALTALGSFRLCGVPLRPKASMAQRVCVLLSRADDLGITRMN